MRRFNVEGMQAALLLLLGMEEGTLRCDASDGAAYESGDSCKPAECAVGRTVVINNYHVSPSKKEE
eukprot:10389063-Ditylum_brightwellii.AAC.1